MNKNKEKLLIYPYGHEFAPIVRNKQLSLNYDIMHLVSPIGFALNNEDAGKADHGSKIGKFVKNDFSKHIDECDTLLVADCKVPDKFKKIIYDNIILAISKKKNIICTLKFEKQQIKQIQKEAELNNVYFRYYGEYPEYKVNVFGDWVEGLIETETPVVFVAGETENTNKFEIQLTLKERLEKSGYKVSQIGSRHYCELFGMHSFPSFMMNANTNEYKKVILFNRLVKKIEENESPDIIIIGIPGGILPFSKKFTNKFGILAFEVSQAVSPDFVIISTLYNELDDSYFDKLNNLTKYRFGFEIDCFNMSNTQFNWNTSKSSKKIACNFLDTEFIDKEVLRYTRYKKPIYHVFNNDDKNKMLKLLIDTLASYSSSELANLGEI